MATYEDPMSMLDSLPYIDAHYSDAHMQADVARLVKEEMEQVSYAPDEILAAKNIVTPATVSYDDHPILKHEMERLRKGLKQIPVDTSRYMIERPEGKDAQDLDAWTRAVDNAYAQLEHQTQRVLNLELLKKFGPNAWRLYADGSSSFQASMQALVDKHQHAVTETNRKRKQSQTAVAPSLANLSKQWYELVAKNLEIEAVCEQMEGQVKKLKAQAQAKGIDVGLME